MSKIPIRNISQNKKLISFENHFRIRRLENIQIGKDIFEKYHRHNFYYFLFIEKGKGEHSIDFETISVENYSVFIVHPQQVHQLDLKSNRRGFLIQFTDLLFFKNNEEIHVIFQNLQHENYFQLETTTFLNIKSHLEEILKEITTKNEKYLEAIYFHLYLIFITLTRNSNNDFLKESSQQKLQFEQLFQLIKTNFKQEKNISFYKEKLHLTSYQLNKLSKKFTDKTCSELIVSENILEAKRQLIITSKQIKNIAFHLGFEDVSYFIRFFKKYTDFSPQSFRKKFQ
ncbi:helix-turn-helix domain-containing protein [Aureivirga marina]|uniref:helix-turn-helix domain-containing protein n=1 Tax=Aureivirga marina TaxID=1182451 RepID=UPI0018C963B8|nr:AraC family transcriptional regulator [Aureivirga marina]